MNSYCQVHACYLLQASFGPFYRIEQLIVSTKDPGAPIVTDANIRLLFEMQAQIDALSAHVPAADGAERTMSLQDVCVKPLGKTCVVLSMLQYWKMDQSVYEKGEAHADLLAHKRTRFA